MTASVEKKTATTTFPTTATTTFPDNFRNSRPEVFFKIAVQNCSRKVNKNQKEHTTMVFFPRNLLKFFRATVLKLPGGCLSSSRTSQRRCSVTKSVLRNFAKFTGLPESLCRPENLLIEYLLATASPIRKIPWLNDSYIFIFWTLQGFLRLELYLKS